MIFKSLKDISTTGVFSLALVIIFNTILDLVYNYLGGDLDLQHLKRHAGTIFYVPEHQISIYLKKRIRFAAFGGEKHTL
jgi:hypothetical protein